jgi:hypothetical protein
MGKRNWTESKPLFSLYCQDYFSPYPQFASNWQSFC